jgi:hypothetical protein
LKRSCWACCHFVSLAGWGGAGAALAAMAVTASAEKSAGNDDFTGRTI